MADSSVEISAGTGTQVDTRTESTNGNHRQVMVIGDPATNAGVAPVDATAGLKVNLGADNDVTLATLPDTAAGDLAAINSAVSGSLDVSGATVTVDATGQGDVPVTLDGETVAISNKSIIGAGDPTIDSYTHAAISASADTANQSLIAAPGASKQIWVYGIQFTVGTGDGSVSFQDEDDTAITGVMPFEQYSGMAQQTSGNFSMPLWKVATNKALEVDTVTCDIKGSIQYAIVSI